MHAYVWVFCGDAINWPCVPVLQVLLRYSAQAGEGVYLAFCVLAGIAALLLPIETQGKALRVSAATEVDLLHVHLFFNSP